MLTNIKAAIFDLDGTLIHSMWVWGTIDKVFAKEHDIVAPEGFYHSMEGMSFTEVAQLYLDTFSLDITLDGIKDYWYSISKELYGNEVPLKPFVVEMLEYCKEHGIKMGIATSNTRELVEYILEERGIAHYFDSIVTSCEVGVGKPAPNVYLKVANELGVEPNHCIVFEDVPNGVLGGKNANMKTCAVEDLCNEELRDRLKELADYYITSYEDILKKSYEVL